MKLEHGVFPEKDGAHVDTLRISVKMVTKVLNVKIGLFGRNLSHTLKRIDKVSDLFGRDFPKQFDKRSGKK